VSQLLPDGFTLYDAPFVFVNAIRTTMVFISWQEHLPREEIPPKKIWLDGDALKEWFKHVEKLREEKAKGTNKPEEGWDGEMVQNPAVAQLIAH